MFALNRRLQHTLLKAWAPLGRAERITAGTEVDGDFRTTVFYRCKREKAHRNLQWLQQHVQVLWKLHPDEIPARRKGHRNGVWARAAKELLAFDSCWETESQFSLMTWCLIYWVYSSAGPVSISCWPAHTGSGGLWPGDRHHEVGR